MAEIDAPVGKVFHGSRDGIVIVGIVLEGTHFHFPSRCPSAVPIERALVRVERAAGVGSVDVPARLWSLGDDVDDAFVRYFLRLPKMVQLIVARRTRCPYG